MLEDNIIFGGPGAGFQPLGTPRISKPEVGFDTLSQKYLIVSSEAQLTSRLDSLFPKGGAHTIHGQMHITTHSPAGGEGGLWEVDVGFKGMMSAKPFKRKETSYSEQASGERILIGADLQALGYPALADRVLAMQSAISTITSYVTTVPPDSDQVGQQVVVSDLPPGFPDLPPPPDSVWSSITDPTWVYPSGWVLDRRDPEQIAGANLWFVVDHHVYHQMRQI